MFSMSFFKHDIFEGLITKMKGEIIMYEGDAIAFTF